MERIILDRVAVTRGERTILNNICFSLPEGQIAVLSGRSGCGKSTLLLAMQGLLSPEEATVRGTILVNGKKVIQDDSYSREPSPSGFLMQNVDAQIVNLISEDELVFGMENRGVSPEEMRARVREYERSYDLFLQKPVQELSGGQKQRLLLASCLIAGHNILFLDEPFANLDLPGVQQLRETLSQLRDRGMTIVLVEHRLELVSDLADVLYWMESGSLTEYRGEALLSFARKKADLLEKDFGWNGTPTGPVLRLENLDARRGKTQVLQNFDLELDGSTTTLLLGENGCGKTTLLRLLCGLSREREFHDDSFLFRDEPIRRYRNYKVLRKKVGFVFQNPSHQLFMRTVEEEIRLRDGTAEGTEELLHLFGIEHLKDRHPFTLSQGEKRMVSVAAVAAGGSDLILLDEPTIGQDYESLLHMAATLRELQERRQTTFLISTHDEQAVRLFGSRSTILTK